MMYWQLWKFSILPSLHLSPKENFKKYIQPVSKNIVPEYSAAQTRLSRERICLNKIKLNAQLQAERMKEMRGKFGQRGYSSCDS